MKKNALILLSVISLAFSPFTLLAQEENNAAPAIDTAKHTPDTTLSKVSFGLILRPQYCYRTLTPDAGYQAIAIARNNYEIAKLGSAIGINFNIELSKAFAIETGILFANEGYQTAKTDSSGMAAPPSQQNYDTYIYSFHYIEIPAKINCTLVKTDKIALCVTVGVSMNVLMAETIEQTVYGAGTSTSTFISGTFGNYNAGLSVIGGLGFSYYLNRKTSLKIEPIYTRSVLGIAPNHLNEQLFSAGVDLGLYIKM